MHRYEPGTGAAADKVAWCKQSWHRGGVPTTTPTRTVTSGQELVVSLLTVARRLRARLPEGRIDPAQMFVLHHVAARGSLRVSALAEAMGLDISTASRHVRQLELGGYLVRTGDPDDRRASRVRLTRRGRGALERAMRARAARLDRAIAGWPEEDRATLTTLMNRLADSLDRLAAEPETR
jgi:DNA-binding MarR family transcriptional regulator